MKKDVKKHVRANMDKRPIVSTLRAMNVGDIEMFPLTQTGGLNSAIHQQLMQEKLDGWKWSIKHDVETHTLAVTRVS